MMAPEAPGLGRSRYAPAPTIAASTTSTMTTGMIGGSVHLALSISSVMGMCPASGAGWLVFDLVASSGMAALLNYVCDPGDHGRCLLLTLLLHRPGKLLRRQRIQHIRFSQPCAPRLQHAVLDFLQVRSVVGIGVDHDLHPALLGHAQVQAGEVEAVGVGIQ